MASIPTPARRGGSAPGAGVDAAARLALAKTLLASDEDVECARAAVEWPGKRAGARRAICALIDAESGKILQVLAHGVPSGQLRNVKVAFEDPGHPLVFALSRTGGFLAIPLLLSEKREARLGLLLVSPSRPELDREARWAAETLGQKRARLWASGALQESERRLARERELLVNVIDASPDPILLTDTEGRMIDGRIELQSKLGHGSTFTLVIPRRGKRR
jgi:PAS domain-containing protein